MFALGCIQRRDSREFVSYAHIPISGRSGMWACEKIDDGAFVGSVGTFQPLDWPEPEIAYSLDRPFWRQGLATEAAKAARDWLFDHLPLHRAASFIRPDNHASKRVAARLGAVCERTFELRGSVYEHWVHYPAGRHSYL